MNDPVIFRLLKKVSRSFYLSLRLLPGPMRMGVGLAYLLARTSDTIADSVRADRRLRIESLRRFSDHVAGEIECAAWETHLVMAAESEGERELLTMTPRIMEWSSNLPPAQLTLVRQVLRTIISGQAMDLERFGEAGRDNPVVIGSQRALDDYTYRVAGCVGEFWTRLGFEAMGDDFSRCPIDQLLALAINYGKGLQLVNILRDLPNDLKAGRCYLPVADARNHQELIAEHARQTAYAKGLVRQGLDYSARLQGRRLRMASVMPAMLAEDTLELLEGVDWADLEQGLKIPRSAVYRILLESLFY